MRMKAGLRISFHSHSHALVQSLFHLLVLILPSVWRSCVMLVISDNPDFDRMTSPLDFPSFLGQHAANWFEWYKSERGSLLSGCFKTVFEAEHVKRKAGAVANVKSGLQSGSGLPQQFQAFLFSAGPKQDHLYSATSWKSLRPWLELAKN